MSAATAAARTPERRLAAFVTGFRLADAPEDCRRTVRLMVKANAGTAFAGAAEDGIAALRALLCEAGGAPQATTFVFGDRLPARAAAQFNATLCRALDFCDAMAPGPHIGAALFPAALAATELAGGCSGADFLQALVVGAEIGSRFNLSEAQYDGFDPTGVAVVFAATAAAARILRLDDAQTVDALALAFNRCGGSFQSHVDGSLGVRIVQGWVAEAGVHCAQLARLGCSGPANFLTGHYGYRHLFGRDTLDADALAADLGDDWRLRRVVFKKYPSCGVTQGVTELALALVATLDLDAADVRTVEVRLPPYAHRLVGHPFRPGANPRVDAQFSAAYCVANALTRRASRLRDFTPAGIDDDAVRSMIARVSVIADPALDARGHTAVDLTVGTTDGARHRRSLDVAPGFPGAGLDDAQHAARFADCLAYAPRPPATQRAARLVEAIDALERLGDARELVGLMQA
ncbi:MAG: MmgE/PrpD family protein [Lautropia sp.]